MGWLIVRYIELGLIDTGLVIICIYCRYLSNWRITRFLCSDCKRVLTSLQRVFRDDVIHTMLKVISISVISTVSWCYINVWYEVAQLCSYFLIVVSPYPADLVGHHSDWNKAMQQNLVVQSLWVPQASYYGVVYELNFEFESNFWLISSFWKLLFPFDRNLCGEYRQLHFLDSSLRR